MSKKSATFLFVSFLLSFFISACGGGTKDTEIAVIVALTQTAAALQQPQAGTIQTEAPATEVPVALSGYQPYEPTACAALNDAASASNGLTGTLSSPVPFSDFVTGQEGAACQVIYSATNATLPTGADPFRDTMSMLTSQGWVEDMRYGAGGATGLSTAVRKDSTLCIVSYERRPVNRDLCSSNEPIGSCFEKLSPEQIIYTLTLTCSTYFP